MTILSKLRDFFNRPVIGPDPWHSGNVTVQVRKGDTLSGLAHRHLGAASRWPEIYALNRVIIGTNPDKIFPGTILMLPRKGKP